MKTKYLLPFFIILTGIFNACEKTPDANHSAGKLEFSINAEVGDETLKSTDSDSASLTYHILLTVLDEDSIPVMEDELIPLVRFGDHFISQKIEFETGVYFLDKFMIVNPAGDVIFASPRTGSPMAYLVQNALPMAFKIRGDGTTRVVPEVLRVIDQQPSDFGYASFGFQIIRPLPFYVSVFHDNPLSMAPSQLIPAKLLVIGEDGWKHEFKLEPRVNKVIIRGTSNVYNLIVFTKNHDPKEFSIPRRKLIATTEENPLMLPVGSPPEMVVRYQPGPEDGKDAMITDLDPEDNFGDHKYFEASFRSEPVLTVMRTKRSLMYINIYKDLPKSARVTKVLLTMALEIPYAAPHDSVNSQGDRSQWPKAVLQQITEPWEENKVTWKNQPATISANQVHLDFQPHLSTIMRTYDVTKLFIPEQEIAAPHHGMMLKLAENTRPGGFRFASSDSPVPEMRPRFTVFYTQN